ncbi:MAG TPA: fibronectin type III domain-containing protein [archaeon]|nr:fibronectin type III domain-containing protein [archaeon]
MAKFPKREIEVQDLAHRMVQGYTDNPSIFTHADIPGLQALLTAYEGQKVDQEAKAAVFHLASDLKDVALHDMEVKMRDEIKQSDVDVGANKQELDLIGWGPRAAPTPTVPPGQVRVFECLMQGPGTVRFDWKPPEHATGGPVRTYKIERREQIASAQEFTAWHEAGIAFATEAMLSDQPRGIRMEYQVVGVNAAGDGLSSNVLPVVL